MPLIRQQGPVGEGVSDRLEDGGELLACLGVLPEGEGRKNPKHSIGVSSGNSVGGSCCNEHSQSAVRVCVSGCVCARAVLWEKATYGPHTRARAHTHTRARAHINYLLAQNVLAVGP